MTLAALTHVLVQPDGKLVVGGVQTNVAGSLVVARLNANGTLDTSFGGGKGYVKPGLGSSSLRCHQWVGSLRSAARGHRAPAERQDRRHQF